MGHKFTSIILQLSTLILLIISQKSYSLTLDDLVATDQLTITTKVNNTEQQIVGSPLVISIEIATNRWFAKGTQVKDFDLQDVIILANNKIVINGTKNIKGKTWVTQTQEITLYPRRYGEYLLPEIEVYVSINTEHNGIVKGILTTDPQRFSIFLPEALAGIEHFIVSPKLEITVSSDFDDKKNYILGDAISREVTITTVNFPAMMIPPLMPITLKGVSIYQKTPKVFDQSNRGELLGTRIESSSYIIEDSGQYLIPEQIIYWWNTTTNELKEVTIPSISFSVGSNISENNTSRHHLAINSPKLFWIILISCLSLCLIFILYLAITRYKKQLMTWYATISELEQRKAKKAFLHAINKQDYIEAYEHLYRYCSILKVTTDQYNKNKEIKQLKKLAFDKGNLSIVFTLTEAKKLLTALKKTKSDQSTTGLSNGLSNGSNDAMSNNRITINMPIKLN